MARKKSKNKDRHDGPLAHVRVLDLTRLYPGPLAAVMMAQMGAEVVKIEDIVRRDPMRLYPPFNGSVSAGFAAVNAGKCSLPIDLDSQKGKHLFGRLVQHADIVLEGFRPGVLDQMGMGYQSARYLNKRIIYVSITGYGQDGPMAGAAGHDINYLALSGLLDMMRDDNGKPVIPAFQIADVAGGAYMALVGALAALTARGHSGEGRHVDVSMADGLLPLLTLQLAHQQAGSKTSRQDMLLSGGLACYGVYRCADDREIALGALENKFWNRFCNAVGKPEWIDKNLAPKPIQMEMRTALEELFSGKPSSEWIALGKEIDCCLTSVLRSEELAGDTRLQARGMFETRSVEDSEPVQGIASPLRFSDDSKKPMRPVPKPGGGSRALLKSLGFSNQELESLVGEGIIEIDEP